MPAEVAELADAQDLKSCGGNIVPVRFRSSALFVSFLASIEILEHISMSRAGGETNEVSARRRP